MSARWQELERAAAEALGGRRVHRRWDHSLMSNVVKKYCKPGETPCVISKRPGAGAACAIVPLSFLGELLNEVRELRKTLGKTE